MSAAQELITPSVASDTEQIRFEYEGTDIFGNQKRMYVYALDESQAEAKLVSAKIDVETITARPPRLRRRRRTLSRDELGTFAIQLAERTESESIPQAIFELSRVTNNPLLRESLIDVYKLIKTEAVNIHEAFESRSDVFPEAFRHIIRVGTVKGNPSDMLRKYGNRQILTASNISKIKGALIYPGVVLSLATCIVIVLAYWILPAMSAMYTALLSQSKGSKLPLLTRALLGFSDFLVSPLGVATLVGAVVVIVLVVRWLRTHNGKDWFQRHSIRWPLIGPLLRQFNAAHVIDLMSILAPMLPAPEFLLEAAAASLNVVYRETLLAIRESQRDGALDLTTAVAPYSYIFGDDFQTSVATGEQTAHLSEQLQNNARLLDRRVEEQTAKLSKLVEPLTLVVAGVLIGLIVIAAYWPLFQIVGDMSNSTH
ncbi:MAG: type pilus assembly protein PilC [Blastocatellia bacterium]|jgi:type IV pilus assembly protein PilC|nr:type pilus assembly protein PilC [Blastocatellia bacterium]